MDGLNPKLLFILILPMPPRRDDYLGYSDEQQKLLYQIKRRFRSKKDIWTYMVNVLVSVLQLWY